MTETDANRTRTTYPAAVGVMGMHRSGTSLAMRAVQLLGVDLGVPEHLMEPGVDNPAGYWENRYLKELDDDLLVFLGGAWDRPPVLDPGWEARADLDDFRDRARQALDDSFPATRAASMIAWKDPRLSILLPFWRTVRPIDTTITIVRDPLEVASSICERNNISMPEAALLWTRYVLAARAADPDGLLVQQRDLLGDLAPALTAIADHLGLEAPTDEVVARVQGEVRPELVHHSAPDTSAVDDHPLVVMARSLWDDGELDFDAIAPDTAAAIARGWLRPPADAALLDDARAREVELMQELRRHKRDSAERQQKAWLSTVRRAGVASAWLDQLRFEDGDDPPIFLRRAGDGAVFVLEKGHRREVRSRLMAEALEPLLGDQRELADREIAQLPEGPPVEVLEGPSGPPFVVIGGTRHVLRGLPVTHPLQRGEGDDLPEGDELAMRKLPKAGDDAPSSWATRRPLPTFLIIGAQKSATRWLRTNLGEHPDVYTAPVEIEFFHDDHHFNDLGPDWYRSQFVGWNGEPIVGEATPAYMMFRHQPDVVASRIKQVTPNAQIIAILRNPIDRAYSAMVHHKRRGRLPDDAKLLELVRATPPEEDRLGLIAGGWYGRSLRPYIKRFGDELLVLLHDDLNDDPAALYLTAARHVGARDDFLPKALAEVKFSNRKGERASPLTPDERAELYEYFVDDIAVLERLTGLDVTRWIPDTRDVDVG